MDEETNKIRQHIDTEREQLGRNLDEMEARVRNATNPKAHFERNTALILGAAVAGGVLLSLAFPKSPTANSASTGESDSRRRTANIAPEPRYPVSTHLHRVSETLDNIFEGLVAVVSDKLQSFVADAVPGFRSQWDTIERQRGQGSVRH